MEQRPKKLLDQVRETIQLKHYSRRTEEAHVNWIERYILFHNKRHPKDLGAPEVEAFLTHLAVDAHVAASTQNQAFSALLFLYRVVLNQPLDEHIRAARAHAPKRLPVVLTQAEVRRLLDQMSGTPRLIAQLLYGSGLRLRVKDLDFARRAIVVRDTKGREDRVTMLPASLVLPLQEHLQIVKRLHEDDRRRGYGQVYLPDALARKYPDASAAWGWQYAFPSDRLSHDPRAHIVCRHHLDESGLQKPSVALRSRPASTNRSARIRCAIRSLRISSKTAMIFARCKNSSVTKPALSMPKGCQDHDDPSTALRASLYPRPSARRPSRAQPTGLTPLIRGMGAPLRPRR